MPAMLTSSNKCVHFPTSGYFLLVAARANIHSLPTHLASSSLVCTSLQGCLTSTFGASQQYASQQFFTAGCKPSCWHVWREPLLCTRCRLVTAVRKQQSPCASRILDRQNSIHVQSTSHKVGSLLLATTTPHPCTASGCDCHASAQQTPSRLRLPNHHPLSTPLAGASHQSAQAIRQSALHPHRCLTPPCGASTKLLGAAGQPPRI